MQATILLVAVIAYEVVSRSLRKGLLPGIKSLCTMGTVLDMVRYILGGAWSDPDYLYRSTDATEPRDRLAINGVRCMKTAEPPPDAALIAIEHPVVDHRQDAAIDDEAFALVRQSFDYDDSDLDARIESNDDAEYWRHQIVSVRALHDVVAAADQVVAHCETLGFDSLTLGTAVAWLMEPPSRLSSATDSVMASTSATPATRLDR